MALDPGRTRVGVAVSDETRTIAQPHSTVVRRADRRDLDEIARLVRELSVTEIVVGLPLQLDGQEGGSAAEARGFGAAVARATGVEVSYLDERLTTRQAERHLIASGTSRARRREIGDQVAATLILQQALAVPRRRAQ
ncbi:MAG TPA: Holliday junction resolvase RuvX [Candidatus Acidoferrales bacterium]|nr:Holliday junction resolvase RuvX [Candidatus Acidoferrales bacterium]